MRDRFSGSMVKIAIAVAAVSAAVMVPITRSSSQAPADSAMALKTPWGEPDLQGIWTAENDIPLQRLPKYADQEYFTEAQRAELDRARSELLARERRAERGTERLSMKHVGARTSLIVDPADGRIPPLTPDAQKTAEREFRCCNRSRLAKTWRRLVREANTIQRARRDSRTFLCDTTQRA